MNSSQNRTEIPARRPWLWPRPQRQPRHLLEHQRHVLLTQGRALQILVRPDLLGQRVAVNPGGEVLPRGGVLDRLSEIDLGPHQQDGGIGAGAELVDLLDPLGPHVLHRVFGVDREADHEHIRLVLFVRT